MFLFEKILVLTRPATRGGKLKYQVYRQPIPVSDLVLEDVDSDGKLGGSFRSAFSQGQPGKGRGPDFLLKGEFALDDRVSRICFILWANFDDNTGSKRGSIYPEASVYWVPVDTIC